MWLELSSPWEENLTESYNRKKSSYSKLESECRSKGWSMILLYVEVAALGHVDTTWDTMSKAVGMKRVESKFLRLKYTKIALQVSNLIVLQAKIMDGAAAHPILRGFPASEPPQRLTQSCSTNRIKLTK